MNNNEASYLFGDISQDHPTHTFASPADWPELEPKMIEAYNRPWRKEGRHAINVCTNYLAIEPMLRASVRAEAYMKLTLLRRENPGKPVHLSWHGFTLGYCPATDSVKEIPA